MHEIEQREAAVLYRPVGEDASDMCADMPSKVTKVQIDREEEHGFG